jgi:hypothetical protein
MKRLHDIIGYLIMLVLLGGLLVSCGGGGSGGTAPPAPQDGSGDPQNFFPTMTTGNSWHFSGTLSRSGTGTVAYANSVTITGTRELQGLVASVWTESNPFNEGRAVDTYIRKDASGVTYLGNNDTADTLTPRLTPYRLANLPLQPGSYDQINRERIDYGADVDGDGRNETFDMHSRITVGAPEPFSSFAGSFTAVPVTVDTTVTVTLSRNNARLLFLQNEMEWYAAGVGPVRRFYYLTFPDNSTESISEELTGYSVEGRKSGIVRTFPLPATAATDPGRPATAFDGSNYLYVSCNESGPSPGLFGVTLTPTGETVKSFPVASFTPQSCLATGPSLAFDGSNYLAVYQRDGLIYGSRVSPAGTLLDGPGGFAISTGTPAQVTNFNPAVAFDGTNYLVVWGKFIDGQYDIYGARVTKGGQVLDEFAVFSAPGEQVFPSLAFDGSNYLVVWRDTRTGSGPSEATDIVGARVTPGGSVLDPQGIAISTASNAQGDPRVIFDGSRYFVAWTDQRLSGFYLNDGLYGTRVARDGRLLDGPADSGGIAINNSGYNTTAFALAFDGSSYLVAWDSANYGSSPPAGIFAAKISAASDTLGGLLVSGPPPATAQYRYPTLLFNGQSSLLTFYDSSTGGGTGMQVYP